jgi:hypothetical protein
MPAVVAAPPIKVGGWGISHRQRRSRAVGGPAVDGGAARRRGRRLGRGWSVSGVGVVKLSRPAREGKEEEAREEKEGKATTVAITRGRRVRKKTLCGVTRFPYCTMGCAVGDPSSWSALTVDWLGSVSPPKKRTRS